MNDIPLLQKHYSTPNNSSTRLKGNMEIGFPNFLYPLISLTLLCGGLVLKRGNNIETLVEKTLSAKKTGLCSKRTLTYPDNKQDYFYSQMTYLQDHELIETVRFGFGFGFGLRLKVSVIDNCLVYRSNGHIWQYGKLRLRFPDWLLLGEATIIEQAYDLYTILGTEVFIFNYLSRQFRMQQVILMARFQSSRPNR